MTFREDFLQEVTRLAIEPGTVKWAIVFGRQRHFYHPGEKWWFRAHLIGRYLPSPRPYVIDPISVAFALRRFVHAAQIDCTLGLDLGDFSRLLVANERNDISLINRRRADAIVQAYVFGEVRHAANQASAFA